LTSPPPARWPLGGQGGGGRWAARQEGRCFRRLMGWRDQRASEGGGG
jgi:hypothetical protein